MKEVPIKEEGLIEIGTPGREEEVLLEIDEWGCACWRNFAGIELAVDLVLEEDDVCISLKIKLYD